MQWDCLKLHVTFTVIIRCEILKILRKNFMTLMCSLTQYFQIKSFRFSLIKTSEKKKYYKKVPFSASKINFLENFRNFKSTNLVFFSNNNITNLSNRHGISVVKLWLKMVKNPENVVKIG